MNLYDFDGTIYNGDSSVDFFKYCLRKNKKTFFTIPEIFIALIMYLLGIKNKTMFKEKCFSFLKYITDIDCAVSAFWINNEVKIKKWYLMQKKDSDIIISASPEFLLLPVCQRLGVKLIASRVDKYSGIFTGENCYGEEKVRRFKSECNSSIIDAFYSDSKTDKPLADLAKNAFLIKGKNIIKWDRIHE